MYPVFKSKDISVFIPSNGSLFKGPIFRFVADNDIRMGISHDGPGQVLRGRDPLNDKEIFANIKWMLDNKPDHITFQPVVTTASKSHLDIVNYFSQAFDQETFRFNDFKLVVPRTQEVLDKICLPVDTLPQYSRKLYMDILTGALGTWIVPIWYARHFVANIGTHKGPEYPVNGPMTNKSVSVTMEGDVVYNHNHTRQGVFDTGESCCYGNVFTSVSQPVIPGTVLTKYYDKCQDCFIRAIGDRGCKFRGPFLDYCCQIQLARLVPVMCLAFTLLTGGVVTDITPDPFGARDGT
jgi:sulfatase maturation enzyme AslB (radical SAM superfamily)